MKIKLVKGNMNETYCSQCGRPLRAYGFINLKNGSQYCGECKKLKECGE